jgi:hypothetical protein
VVEIQRSQDWLLIKGSIKILSSKPQETEEKNSGFLSGPEELSDFLFRTFSFFPNTGFPSPRKLLPRSQCGLTRRLLPFLVKTRRADFCSKAVCSKTKG